MKRFYLMLIMVLLGTMLFGAGAFTTDAKVDYQDLSKGKTLYQVNSFIGEIDSTETLYSSAFRLDENYAQEWISKISLDYELDKDASGDTLNVIFYIYGSFDGSNYVVVDTITTVTTETYGIADITMTRYYDYYKIYITGSTGNYNDVGFEVNLRTHFDEDYNRTKKK